MTTQRERLFEIAHALGHTDPTVWETRSGAFFCSCACGWESTNRPSLIDALGAGVHHALTIARPVASRARSSGRPLPVVIAAEQRRSRAAARPLHESDPARATRRETARQVA